MGVGEAGERPVLLWKELWLGGPAPWLLPRGLLEAFPGARAFFWTIVFAAASPCKRRIQESSWKMEITENLAAESCAACTIPRGTRLRQLPQEPRVREFHSLFTHTKISLCFS